MAARKRGSGSGSGGRKAAKTPVEDARARMYRELLFATGEVEFGANGFTGTTMQQIASAAGVSLKTLYAYYPSKSALYEEVMQVRASAFVEAVSRGLESADDPVERIEGGVRAYVEFLFEHEQWLQIHLRDRVSWSLRPRSTAAAAEWKRGLGDFSKALTEGMDRGLFYREDALELAAVCQGLMQQHMARALNAGERDPELVVERTLTHLMRLVRKPASGAAA